VLAALIGRRPEAVAIDSAPLQALPPETAAAPQVNVSGHPAAQAAQARVRQQAAEVSAAGSQYAPQFDVVGSAYTRGSGKSPTGVYRDGDAGLGPSVSNWAVGVQVTLPLGSFPALHAQQAGEKARLQAEQA